MSTKLLRQYEKESLLQSAQRFVGFFNVEDPVENFRNYPYFNKIAEKPEAQEKLRQYFNRVREAIKNMIIAYEDFWQGRAENVKPLWNAAGAVSSLPTKYVRYSLGVRNDGNIFTESTRSKPDEELDLIIRDRPRRRSDCAEEELSEEEKALALAVSEISSYIESFKHDLAHYKEHFPIGVCRYKKCRKFFVKKRKDERYCNPTHKKLAWQDAKREAARLGR